MIVRMCITVFVPCIPLKEMGMIGYEYDIHRPGGFDYASIGDMTSSLRRQERNLSGYMLTSPLNFELLSQDLSILMTSPNRRIGSN